MNVKPLKPQKSDIKGKEMMGIQLSQLYSILMAPLFFFLVLLQA